MSAQIRELSGLEVSSVPPNELITALLKAEADLLWFGGIGTYVRNKAESNLDVGDRANDALRITSDELNVKVVGEGANLGMTQLARIAFAKAGGCVNSDAIDNSAGVNSSDLEVNIKIALGQAMRDGKFNREERNEILAGMTEEVAQSCLRNNYLQTLALSLAERRGFDDLGFQQRLMRTMERDGKLDRAIEFLPTDGELSERRQQNIPLTRPELAVLLAYAKIDLFEELVDSDLPDDPYLESELMAYFPQTLREGYKDEVRGHRLKREIIATRLSNALINRGGESMVIRLKEQTGHSAADITRAFIIAREVFGAADIYNAIDALDNKIKGARQIDLYLRMQDLMRNQTAWFLRHADFSEGLQAIIEKYRSGQAEFSATIGEVLSKSQVAYIEQSRKSLMDEGLDEALADKMAHLGFTSVGPDIVSVSYGVHRPVGDIARIFCRMGEYFRISDLRRAADAIPIADYFDRLAVNSTLEVLASAERALAADIVRQAGDGVPSFEQWQVANKIDVERTRHALGEMLDSGDLTFSKFAVAVSQLRALAST